MKEFTQNIKAEFKKVRHTPFILIHLLIPLIGLILFLTYYQYSIWSRFY
jgi:ABC-2 type transport system permease protein